MSHFLASEIQQPALNEALFHLIPVPYEHSVSYGAGTRNGPSTIIHASDQLETHDQLGGEPYKFGIYTHEAVDCRGEVGVILERIRHATKTVAERQQIPFVFGGEHTISYGAVMGVKDVHEKIGVIQIDAHADLREEYQGSIWSHACVMKRLADEGLPIIQLGVRAISIEEQSVRNGYPNQIRYADAKDFCNPPKHHYDIPADFPEKVYLTVDIDGLDGTVMPATGTPVAGGLSWWQLIDIIKSIASQRNIVGMDLVEFSPIQGFHVYDFMAADLAHKMMGIVGRSKK